VFYISKCVVQSLCWPALEPLSCNYSQSVIIYSFSSQQCVGPSVGILLAQAWQNHVIHLLLILASF